MIFMDSIVFDIFSFESFGTRWPGVKDISVKVFVLPRVHCRIGAHNHAFNVIAPIPPIDIFQGVLAGPWILTCGSSSSYSSSS